MPTLAHLPALAGTRVGPATSINYGMDRLRFPAPLPQVKPALVAECRLRCYA